MHIKWNTRQRRHDKLLVTATAVRSVRRNGRPTHEVIGYLGSYRGGQEGYYRSRYRLIQAIDALPISAEDKKRLKTCVDQRLPPIDRAEAHRQWREDCWYLGARWVGPFKYEGES